MLAGRDHVLLMHVGCGEGVQQRQESAGAPEKSRASGRVGASGVIDEFRPTVAVARQRARRFQRDGGTGGVEPLDQAVPGHVEPQVFRLVHDPRTVGETNDLYRTAAIVRIGQLAFDRDDATAAGRQELATDRRQIGIEAHSEFARSVDPLPGERRQQAQQHWLVFEQGPQSARLHVGDESVVARHAGAARLGKALVDGGGAEIGQGLEERKRELSARGFGEVFGRPHGGALPKPNLGLFDDRHKQLFERTDLVRKPGRRFGARGGTLHCRLDPDGVVDPWRTGRAGAGANRGQPLPQAGNRQAVAFEPPGKQRLVARGGGAAPCGETPRRQIGIAVRGRTRFEGLGQQFVDGRRAKPQALVKGIHRYRSDQVSQFRFRNL